MKLLLQGAVAYPATITLPRYYLHGQIIIAWSHAYENMINGSMPLARKIIKMICFFKFQKDIVGFNRNRKLIVVKYGN